MSQEGFELNLPPFPELSEQFRARIGEAAIVFFAGPTEVGKSTQADALTDRYPDIFGSIRSFMDRPIKLGEPADAAHFLPRTPETHELLQAKAAAGEILNIIQHPTTGNIYGTFAEDFVSQYNILPTLTSAIPEFRRQTPFRQHVTVAFATSPGVWDERVMARARGSHEAARDMLKRLDEAQTCLEWCRQDDQTIFFSATPNRIAENTRRLKQIILSEIEYDDTFARGQAEAMLASIPRMKQQVKDTHPWAR
jgi:guanylate kinase